MIENTAIRKLLMSNIEQKKLPELLSSFEKTERSYVIVIMAMRILKRRFLFPMIPYFALLL